MPIDELAAQMPRPDGGREYHERRERSDDAADAAASIGQQARCHQQRGCGSRAEEPLRGFVVGVGSLDLVFDKQGDIWMVRFAKD